MMYNSVQTGPKTIFGGLKKAFLSRHTNWVAPGTATGKKAHQQTQGDTQGYGNDFIRCFRILPVLFWEVKQFLCTSENFKAYLCCLWSIPNFFLMLSKLEGKLLGRHQVTSP